MEIQVEVKQVFETQSFAKRDGSGNIVKGAFLGETMTQYKRMIKFDIFGEEKVSNILPSLVVGQQVVVSFDPQSREWQGKWFTELQVWKVSAIAAAPAVAPARPQEKAHDVPADNNAEYDGKTSDDLPF